MAYFDINESVIVLKNIQKTDLIKLWYKNTNFFQKNPIKLFLTSPYLKSYNFRSATLKFLELQIVFALLDYAMYLPLQGRYCFEGFLWGLICEQNYYKSLDLFNARFLSFETGIVCSNYVSVFENNQLNFEKYAQS